MYEHRVTSSPARCCVTWLFVFAGTLMAACSPPTEGSRALMEVRPRIICAYSRLELDAVLNCSCAVAAFLDCLGQLQQASCDQLTLAVQQHMISAGLICDYYWLAWHILTLGSSCSHYELSLSAYLPSQGSQTSFQMCLVRVTPAACAASPASSCHALAT